MLKVREKIAYGIGDVANGLAVASTGFWLLFYLTEVVKLSPALAGAALMIGRAWDACTDPVMGWISDNTRSRWGKRRPYLLFGSFTYALSFFALWTIPVFDTEMTTFVYTAIVLILFNTFFTVVFIPYTSLTAAITSDYNERTSLTGYRMVFSQIAFLIGAAVPNIIVPLVSSPRGNDFLTHFGVQSLFGSWAGTERQGYFLFAATFGILMIVCVLVCFLGTEEREVGEDSGPASSHSPMAYAKALVFSVRSNLPFRMSLVIKLLSTCAITIIGVKLPYYIRYVLNLPEAKTEIIAVLFVTAILATPLWVLISKRHGKVETYVPAMGGYMLVLCAILMLGESAAPYIYLIAVAAGIFHAAALLIPWTIIPDVVEYDEVMSGHRREGLLYGGTTFAYKLASALAIFAAGVGLEFFGYQPDGVQTERAVDGIVLVVSVLPMILLLFSVFAAKRYPLSRARHAEIVAELHSRKGDAS